jgi:hypothetical protein
MPDAASEVTPGGLSRLSLDDKGLTTLTTSLDDKVDGVDDKVDGLDDKGRQVFDDKVRQDFPPGAISGQAFNRLRLGSACAHSPVRLQRADPLLEPAQEPPG